jgi:hypothetical protein
VASFQEMTSVECPNGLTDYFQPEDARNITWQNITIEDGAKSPLVINQCYSNVDKANCSTSTFDISDIHFADFIGTINTIRYADFQCSRSQDGCDDMSMDNVEFINISGEEEQAATGIRCSNVNSPEGFKC